MFHGIIDAVMPSSDVSTDLWSSFFFLTRTWGARDLSPGGSIYVQNKKEQQLICIPALQCTNPLLLGKNTV